jgi:hypothetical protein
MFGVPKYTVNSGARPCVGVEAQVEAREEL